MALTNLTWVEDYNESDYAQSGHLPYFLWLTDWILRVPALREAGAQHKQPKTEARYSNPFI
ncbi:hypothetical protein [uncultured Algoriphagus sp.]|uniref:hypothetical protein n=1 Tax=uncultured Algoriphagus sp. TaxID=417365 RepID=UPI000C4C0A4D|nr:hypothetical protein [Algoriphagus sp.]MAN88728.1 hypothetical protein [Algoriphagus sp.]HAH37537.1 hypothetical protein [Algoriphagus sp.]HAS57568.1 hypothetical protein [Algoriphagus sp.]HCH44160.1 hypothetical protein [Algoriphagus sp.]